MSGDELHSDRRIQVRRTELFSTVVADGIRRASALCFFSLLELFWGHGLPMCYRKADFIVPPEKIRRRRATNITIDTRRINVIGAWNILLKSVSFVCHSLPFFQSAGGV